MTLAEFNGMLMAQKIEHSIKACQDRFGKSWPVIRERSKKLIADEMKKRKLALPHAIVHIGRRHEDKDFVLILTAAWFDEGK